jgi:uncharacterized protein (TIGR02996 family)
MIDLRPAFLADIVEHPDEDAPRLIFSDWLEDNGEPEWAEFIRLQIRLTSRFDPKREDNLSWVERQEITARCEDMLRAKTEGVPLWCRWCNLIGVPSFYTTPHAQPHLSYGWNRGILTSVAGPWRLWKQWGPKLVHMQPIRQFISADPDRIPKYVRRLRKDGDKVDPVEWFEDEGPIEWLSVVCIRWAKKQKVKV